MPGIVGIITKLPRPRPEAELAGMIAVMLHEPFYVSGTWACPAQGVYAGWVAREGSFAARMPQRNERGDITLIFAGEEFSDSGVRRGPRQQGHAVEAEGPNYLVDRYGEEADFPKSLNGRFHGVVVDEARGRSLLFNDRYGLQRLYIYEAPDAFYFAAEAKAILAVRPELRELDARGLGEFLACGCVLGDRTLFRGIRALPPASAWTFRDGRLERSAAYFEPREWEEQEPDGAEEFHARLRDAFASALPRYFRGGERMGVSLTGGLDTRILLAWAKAAPGTLPCYTFGSMYRENQDVKLARRVARICGQPHQVIIDGRECLDHFADLAERTVSLTDGCVEVSRACDLYNFERARQIAPARLSGLFGSEIIRQAVMFNPVLPPPELFAPEVVAQARAAEETYAAARRTHPVSFVAFRQSPWYLYGGLALERAQMTLRAPFLDNAVVRAIYRAPRAGGEDSRMRLIREGNAELARLRTDRGIGARGARGALQRAYLEFTFKAEYAYDYGMPQWVARADHALAALHLERLWLGRHKVFHFRIWYRTFLANYVREILLDPASLQRPYLRAAAVEKIVGRHLRGTHNYTTEIHRLLSLELVHRLFVDHRPAPIAGPLPAVATSR